MKNDFAQRILGQISEVRDPILFKAFHQEHSRDGGHALDRHLLSQQELVKALRKRRKPNFDEILKVTRFFDEISALNFIADALEHNLSDIEKWLLSSIESDLVIHQAFKRPVGDGIAKNMDWTKPIPMHSLTVVLRKNSRLVGRSFVVVTAYPDATMDDNDVIYDAIDEYLAGKGK